jgi:hypothetical protein
MFLFHQGRVSGCWKEEYATKLAVVVKRS